MNREITITDEDVVSIFADAEALNVSLASFPTDAEAMRKLIVGFRAKIGDEYDQPIKDAHKLHKSLVAKKKRHTDSLDRAWDLLAAKYGEHREHIDKQHGEAQQAALDAGVDVIVAKPDVEYKGVQSFQERWEIVSINDDELPREYMMRDEKAINATVRALGEQANIPGVKVRKVVRAALKRS